MSSTVRNNSSRLSTQNPEFSTLFLDICEKSILTGVPQIAQARKKSRRILKTFVLFSCLAGFVYQTTSFLLIYWSYPTLVDVQIIKPLALDLPSLTICNRNGLRRTKFCQAYPSLCEVPQNMTAFCQRYGYVCDRAKIKDDFMRPKLEAMVAEEKISREDLLKIGHASYPLIERCLFGTEKDPFGICEHKNFRYYTFLDIYQRVKLCHIVNPKWAAKKLKYPTVPTREVLTMVLDFEPTEAFRLDRQPGGQVAIHSPFTVVNPFLDGFNAKPGTIYVIKLREIVKHLLPSPYLTNCTDYFKLWKKRLGRGPLTREMCIEECLMNATLDHCGCVKKSNLYPHYEKFCTESDIGCLSKINFSHCFIACGPACQDRSFEYDIQEEAVETGIEGANSTTKWNQTALLMIFFKKSSLVVYTYRPKYESIELYSYLGGFIGIWLGMSLIAIIDFLESLCSLIPIVKDKIKVACQQRSNIKSASSEERIITITPYPYNPGSQISIRTRSMPRAWD